MVKVRDQELAYIPEMSDAFFEALDSIVFLTDNSGVNTDAAIDLDALKVRLAAIAASGTDAAETAAQALAATAARPVVRTQPMMPMDADEPDDGESSHGDADAHEPARLEPDRPQRR